MNWFLEDEFTAGENLNEEDERKYEISISSIRPPFGTAPEGLKGKMDVKAKET